MYVCCCDRKRKETLHEKWPWQPMLPVLQVYLWSIAREQIVDDKCKREKNFFVRCAASSHRTAPMSYLTYLFRFALWGRRLFFWQLFRIGFAWPRSKNQDEQNVNHACETAFSPASIVRTALMRTQTRPLYQMMQQPRRPVATSNLESYGQHR